MQPDGTYARAERGGEKAVCAQDILLGMRPSITPKRKRKGAPQKRKRNKK